MPELPELEVVREVLQRRAVGQTIAKVEIRPPGGLIVVRDLTHAGFAATLTGTTIASVARRGKFLVFSLQTQSKPLFLVVNPKLTGRLQLAAVADKRMPRTHVEFTFADGRQLRYVDQKQMGQLYLSYDLESVPDYAGMGPEPFDISLEEFRTRLKPFRGEIKGVLTRKEFVAGIGNAYADEILWAARLYPYRKRTQLNAEEVARLYEAMRTTLAEAVEKVRTEMGEQIELKPRDFLAIHMKTGQPCPRCGTPISLIGANQRITNFCRTCQPGGLIRGM
ncbi:MAG: DNA-formamidopyrimidine glycosylase family protein [Anaerolineaceae bacterium]|jgi:formamidopyrimidine-DNA glycosylase